jgi:hypothetical protein
MSSQDKENFGENFSFGGSGASVDLSRAGAEDAHMVVRQGAVAVKETTPGMGPSSTTKHGKIEIHPVSVTIDQAEFAEMDTVVSSAAQCEEWTNSVKEQIRKTPELKILLDTMQTGDDARLYFASSKGRRELMPLHNVKTVQQFAKLLQGSTEQDPVHVAFAVKPNGITLLASSACQIDPLQSEALSLL